MVADALTSNMRQAINNHHGDWAVMFVQCIILHNIHCIAVIKPTVIEKGWQSIGYFVSDGFVFSLR